jgi:hypothetical protein
MLLEFNPLNFLIYFSLAWGANIVLNLLYVIKRYVPGASRFDRPLDFKIIYKKNRLIGDSITIAGLAVSLLFGLILYILIKNIVWSIIPIIVFMGDLLGSFIKRRISKKRGEFVLFVDHGNYMILLGAIFMLLHYIDIFFAFTALLLTYMLHPLACIIAYRLNLRENPY